MSPIEEIIPGQIYVIKRCGDRVPFDKEKIKAALEKVFVEVDGIDVASSQAVREEIDKVSYLVEDKLNRIYVSGGIVNIEDIQDQVELGLMRNSRHQIARAYVIYRENRKNARGETNHVREVSLEEKIKEITLAARHKAGYTDEGVDLTDVIRTACAGVYNNITEAGIRELVIMGLRSMIERGVEYSYIAAQVAINNSYEDCAKVLETPNVSSNENELFKPIILKGIELGRLDPELANFDLDRLAAAIDCDRNMLFTYLSYTTLYDRYFIHHNKLRYETPQVMFMRVAMGVALKENGNRNDRAIEFYDVLSRMNYMASTPTLFNAGTIRPQLSSCFLSTVPDDLYGIYSSLRDNAMLSKWSGGIGNDWTPVRALSSHIEGTNGESQGVVPFLKVNNDTAVAVNQGGKRKGAICSYLETFHLDIEEFLELRKNTGDDRRRTHDMNTANWIPDLFMIRLMQNGNWTLFTPSEVPDLHDLTGEAFRLRYEYYESVAVSNGMLHKVVKATDLWRKMLTMLFETGHPWLTWKDPCNLRSPQQHCGVVHSSNLCTEITLNTSEEEVAVCNLGSINLVHHMVNKTIDREKLRKTIKVAVRMLDNVIDVNYYPIEQARTSNQRHRPVGLGIMGFHDALYIAGIQYNSDEAVEFADELMEIISFYAIEASAGLAIERGKYESFEGSLWSKGVLPYDSMRLVKESRPEGMFIQDTSMRIPADQWDALRRVVMSTGMRNSNVMAIAPTATISNICGVSQSIEPTFKNLYVKSNLSGEFTVINDYLVRELKAINLWNQQTINDLKVHDGEIENIDYIPREIKDMFRTAFGIEPRYIISAASRRQKWIDQAQSLNLYIANASGKLLDITYKMAWLEGLKTTYYLRALSATQTEKSTVSSSALRAVKAPEPTPVVAETKPADDYLADAQAADVPKACSIDNPDCEACQ